MFYLLMGLTTKRIELLLKNSDGIKKVVKLQSLFIEDDGNYFLDRIIDLENPLKITYEEDIAIIKITSFSDQAISDKITEVIHSKEVTSLVFDLRYNMGGNDQIAYKIISSLISKDTSSPTYKYSTGSPALRQWGIPDKWEKHSTTIQPSKTRNTHKKVYILVNGATSSTAEDFTMVLKNCKRATVVGSMTAGSSGNPYSVKLPYGGILRVSTFVALTHDGIEYVGVGINPDINISQTLDDLKNGIDTQLQYILNMG